MLNVVCTRLYIAATVSCQCRFVSKPQLCHWTAAKRVLRYLKGTSNRGISFQHHPSGIVLNAFADSTWGSDPSSSMSVSGQIVYLGPSSDGDSPPLQISPISWRSALQSVVAQSTCEAEYIVVASVCQEILFLCQMVTDLGHPPTRATVVFCDNHCAIHNVTRGCTSRKTRHIALKYHLSRDLAAKDIIRMVYVPTDDNCADILTKHVPSATAHRLASRFMTYTCHDHQPLS
jgi:hypothetical protein